MDGYLNPGDKILVRIGDRRWGSKGTRAQTYVEDNFLMRWYIDPVGTSRFAPIKPDIAIPILPGHVNKIKAISPRVVRPTETFPLHIHTEDAWGNTTADQQGLRARVAIQQAGSSKPVWDEIVDFPSEGWTVNTQELTLPDDGDYTLTYEAIDSDGATKASGSDYISASSSLCVPRPLFADLHVHSDDTVGTNSTTYNFSYGQQVSGLDVIGYTANDFNVTKERWDATLEIIKKVNAEGKFIVYPGTEWCGNSCAGGDHNVVFLDDPSNSVPEFPYDRHGNVARSFEWNENGLAELQPGAWPLDEVYATYARDVENVILIPHVGGRRANLAWHHPQLERLIEIGSAWGLFEWMLRDAAQRGWKLGVSANSDEHRGRCGGGVPGTAVFGTKGGLTGVLADSLDWKTIGRALRARRTFATSGERLVGLVSTKDGYLHGDEFSIKAGKPVKPRYGFYGSSGFSSIEAWDATGEIFRRDLQREATQAAQGSSRTKLRVRWGGASLYDRYREAVWRGSILAQGAEIALITPFGGISDNPEEQITHISSSQVTFGAHTSGDFDGVDIYFAGDELPSSVSVTGSLGGYVKTGNALAGNPHKPQPTFSLTGDAADLKRTGGTSIAIAIAGGAELFVSAELIAAVELPTRVGGVLELPAVAKRGDDHAVYFVGREYSGVKVITSPMFISFT